jgi:predicted nucleic acid-binding protein
VDAAARALYEAVAAQPAFRIEPHVDVAVAAQVFLSRHALTHANAVAVAVAKAGGHELLTFDGDQRSAAEN